MTLYELQNRWDDERANQRTAQLRDTMRHQVAADCRALPLILLAAASMAVLFAALLP